MRTCSGKSWIVLGDATSSIRFLVPEIRMKDLVITSAITRIFLSHLHFNLTAENQKQKSKAEIGNGIQYYI